MDEASTEGPRSESHPESRDRGPHDIRGREAGWKAFLLQSRFPHLFIIVVLGFLVYSNTFYSPFQWDEAVYIADRPFIKDLTYFIKPSLAQGDEGLALRNRYIGYLTFALDYRLHGFDVFGYHVVNLAIHLINAMLVYFFVLLTFRTPYFSANGKWQSAKRIGQEAMGNDRSARSKAQRPAQEESSTQRESRRSSSHSLLSTPYFRFLPFVVALLFVAHPLQTEAVTYVFQRLASLVTLFYLLSLVLYIKGRLEVGG